MRRSLGLSRFGAERLWLLGREGAGWRRGGGDTFDPVAKYLGRLPQWYPNIDSTITRNGTGLVSQSADLGPLGRHLKQAADARKCTYVSTHVNTNGRPGLNFTNNAADATPQWLDTDAHAPETDETIMFVGCGDSSAATSYIYDNASATLASFTTSTPTTYCQYGGFYDTTYKNQAGGSAESLRNWPFPQIYTIKRQGSNARLMVNGVWTAATGACGANARTALRWGSRGGAIGSQGYRGVFGPILRLPFANSDENCLADQWSLRGYLPETWTIWGDSRTEDVGAHGVPVGSAWPSLVRDTGILGRAVRIINLGAGGAGASTVLGLLTAANLTYGSLRWRNTRAIQWIDINDIKVPPGTVTAANEFTALMNNAAIMATAPFTSVEIVTGCNYTGDERQGPLNTLLLAQPTYDLLRFDNIGPVATSDGQHPSTAGHVQLAMAAIRAPVQGPLAA